MSLSAAETFCLALDSFENVFNQLLGSDCCNPAQDARTETAAFQTIGRDGPDNTADLERSEDQQISLSASGALEQQELPEIETEMKAIEEESIAYAEETTKCEQHDAPETDIGYQIGCSTERVADRSFLAECHPDELVPHDSATFELDLTDCNVTVDELEPLTVEAVTPDKIVISSDDCDRVANVPILDVSLPDVRDCLPAVEQAAVAQAAVEAAAVDAAADSHSEFNSSVVHPDIGEGNFSLSPASPTLIMNLLPSSSTDLSHGSNSGSVAKGDCDPEDTDNDLQRPDPGFPLPASPAIEYSSRLSLDADLNQDSLSNPESEVDFNLAVDVAPLLPLPNPKVPESLQSDADLCVEDQVAETPKTSRVDLSPNVAEDKENQRPPRRSIERPRVLLKPRAFTDIIEDLRPETEAAEELTAPKTYDEIMIMARKMLRNSKSIWAKRCSAMDALSELLKSSSPPTLLQDISALKVSLAAQIDDSRSAVVRSVCRLIASLSEVCKQSFAELATFFVPKLLSRLYVTIKVISSSADQCLKSILQSLKSGAVQLMPKLIQGLSDSHAAVRRGACIYIRMVIDTVTSSSADLEPQLNILSSALTSGLRDADREVRVLSRAALHAVSSLFPDFTLPGDVEIFDLKHRPLLATNNVVDQSEFCNLLK